jgi:putative addiction module component (TIGR02574 family)
MSQAYSNFDFSSLNSAEKLDLISQIWDSIPQPHEVPESHREELKRRVARANAEPEAAIPWDEVKSRLKSKP